MYTYMVSAKPLISNQQQSPWLIRKNYTTMYWWPLGHIISLPCLFNTQWVSYGVLYKSLCIIVFLLFFWSFNIRQLEFYSQKCTCNKFCFTSWCFESTYCKKIHQFQKCGDLDWILIKTETDTEHEAHSPVVFFFTAAIAGLMNRTGASKIWPNDFSSNLKIQFVLKSIYITLKLTRGQLYAYGSRFYGKTVWFESPQ